MSAPIEMDIPHDLGKSGVRARLDGGIGKLGQLIPGGATVTHRWDGDTMHFAVRAMGQEIASTATVFDDKVHAVVNLPGFLRLFAAQVQAAIQKEAPKLLK
ncbi:MULTISPECIES: polyhydroxyalkanoic acid system family protein [unclassified Sphingomonas]|uniref:polyhydroxyalkanoic acid system family protein n=1 Tax=unclassified Sphingomonas TaxID=196159 RepID=UPI00226A5A65|nr:MULTISPECIES: polyhydroxyalkanoic acid system family protein [unclassified Sphingomonas]